MPRNVRPSGWYYDGNPDYKGTTVAERRQMQNTWDLLEQQEIANQIEQEKIEQEKINNANLINAINNSNLINKQINDNNNKTLKEIEEMKTQRVQLEHYYKICDDIGIDYEDIRLFLNKLNESNTEINDKINELTLKLDNIKNKKYNNEQNRYNQYINSYNRVLIKLGDVEDELNNLSIFNKLFNKQKIFKLNQKRNELQKKLNELNKLIENYEPTLYNTKNEINGINKQINDLLDLNKQYISNKYKKFIDFRKNHYNKEMEILFKKLNIGYLYISEMIKEGTKQDYIDYIKDNIL